MRRFLMVLSIMTMSAVSAGAATDTPEPPRAKIVPKQMTLHGDTRTDNYYWLKEREDPEVIAYLEAENAYTEAVMAHTKELQEALFQEITGRIKQDDESVPYKKHGYYYYTRYESGGEYPLYCRRKGSMDAPEEVMINVNALAKGHEFFLVDEVSVSPSNEIAAYSVDKVGRRLYTMRFRNLKTGKDYLDAVMGMSGEMVWANDNKTVFYTKKHPETLRWYQVYRHTLGTDPVEDALIYEEVDDTFSCSVEQTKSGKYILIFSEHTLSTEYRYLDASDPNGEFQIFQPRQRAHEYYIEHLGDAFYVLTNDRAKNFRLMKTPVAATEQRNWREVVPHRADVFLDDFDVFRDHLVTLERRKGLVHMRVRPLAGGEPHDLDFGEPTYYAEFGDNYDLDSNELRYVYTSLTTPSSTFDYEMSSRHKTLLKEETVLGGFDKSNYKTERLVATAHDDTRVPISIVYRKGMVRDGRNPMLLIGYGSYGYSYDAEFASYRVSLLDRGFILGIAHIRGGQEMGREWYEDGKMMNKINTFTDFIDCAKHVIAENYTSSDRLFARGGSAGGLLMGAITNMAPELFKGVINGVPFVDVVTTMLDPDIPLTTSEYDEWGNPNEKAAYDYMLSYSPYDQIEAKNYPHILVTTGLHDSQVQYWEPAKYVAKMRALKTDGNRLLLKTNMEAGHGGSYARFAKHRRTALRYAFMLDLVRPAN